MSNKDVVIDYADSYMAANDALKSVYNKMLAQDYDGALEMICHKIGRIINGDPNYVDSWVDIAGYAKLVADRLSGVER